MTAKPFSERIRQARLTRGLPQTAFVNLVPALSVRTLQAWEAGRQQPPEWAQRLLFDRLKKRCGVCGAPLKRPDDTSCEKCGSTDFET